MSNRLAQYVKLASAPAGVATAATVGVPAQTASADIVVYEIGQSLNQQLASGGSYFTLASSGYIALTGVESLGLNFSGSYFGLANSNSSVFYNWMNVGGGMNALISGTSSDVANLLAAGDVIGPGGTFKSSMVLGYSSYFALPGYNVASGAGFQRNGQTSYLGIAFNAAPGVTNYGWVEINWDGMGALEVVRWAYEDDGSAIAAGAVPAPGAVGLLALAAGAAGVRRKRAG